MIEERVLIINYIKEIEDKFPVSDWKIKNIHVWPFLRIKLYFFIYKQLNTKNQQNTITSKNNSNRKRIPKDFLNQLKNYIKFKIWLKGLKKKKNLFFTHAANSSIYENKNIIRFLDPLILKYNLKEFTTIFVFGYEKSQNSYNQEIKVDFNYGLNLYESYKKYFKEFFKMQTRSSQIPHSYLEFLKYISDLFNDNRKLDNEIDIWEDLNYFFDFYSPFVNKIIKKINPENFFVLSYYDSHLNQLFTSICNNLGIKTIEMQHGPQSVNQLAYGSWTKIPQDGFNSMPKNYWCWDEISTINIKEWKLKKNIINAFVGGNPWIDFLKDKGLKTTKNNYILYSLQPNPVKLSEMFPPQIIKIIKEKKYEWHLRTHPRQELELLVNFLIKQNIFESVQIEDSNIQPLPISIFNCLVHVTNFSGTSLEVALMGKKTILLNNIGRLNCIELIQNEMAIYINPEEDNFENRFYEFIETGLNSSKYIQSKVDFDDINKLIS